MSSDPQSAMRPESRLRHALGICAGLAMLAGIAGVTWKGHRAAEQLQDIQAARAASRAGSAEAPPVARTSDAAMRLNQIARALSLPGAQDLELSELALDAMGAGRPFNRFALYPFVRTLAQERDERAQPALPPELQSWLASNSALIEAASLEASSPQGLEWARDGVARVPRAILELRDVFMARALVDMASDDRGSADRMLRAAWNVDLVIGRSLMDRRSHALLDVLAALRQLQPDDPREWIARLDDAPWRELTARRISPNLGEQIHQLALGPDLPELSSLPEWARGGAAVVLAGPDTWVMSRQAERLLQFEKDLQVLAASPCNDPSALVGWELSSKPFPSARYRLVWLRSEMKTLRACELDLALTRRVLARAAVPPLPLADVCDTAPFIERVEDDGRVTIAWAGEHSPEPWRWGGTQQVLTFTFEAGAAPAQPSQR